jgi:hypothetical protein
MTQKRIMLRFWKSPGRDESAGQPNRLSSHHPRSVSL